MIAEITMVLTSLKMLNDGIKTVKEAGGNLESLCGNWADATEKVQEVERKRGGSLSYKEAIALEGASRRLKAFNRDLKDVCLMQGQGDLYESIQRRIQESKYAHEKELKIIKKRRAENKKLLKMIGTAVFSWMFFMAVLVASIFFYRNR